LLNQRSFSKRKYPLPFYRGHYMHDTPMTQFRWGVVVLTVFMHSGSPLRINIYFKVNIWFERV